MAVASGARTAWNRHDVGPDPAVTAAWEAAGLDAPDLPTMRRFRLDRLRAELSTAECDGALLYDPVMIRYATDTTNMSIWTMHNPVRYAWVPTEGPVVMFEFSHGEFLDAHSDVVDEIRPATSLLPFFAGDRTVEAANRWAGELVELIVASARSGGRRVAVDTLSLDGLRALEARGVEVVSGLTLFEHARAVKSDDEIRAMRRAAMGCAAAIDELRAAAVPGVTEDELWSLLQATNVAWFGEWVETRLLCSGARTNPWYQEASSKPIADGEILAFDTDMIGAYGYCIDVSRSWLVGGARPTAAQTDVHSRARDMIEANIPLFRAGVTIREITERMHYPPVDEFNSYTVLAHGTGLCDEYPAVYPRELWEHTGYDALVEVGNVFSVEAFVGRRDGGEGVKLEEQILVTETGPELVLDRSLDLL